jgi:hypothetical protein
MLVGSATKLEPLPKGAYDLPKFMKETGADKLEEKERAKVKEALETGCVGVVGLYLMSPSEYLDLLKRNKYPEDLPNVEGPWLLFEDARKLKGREDKVSKDDAYIIFAVTSDWAKTFDPRKHVDRNGIILNRGYLLKTKPDNKDVTKPGAVWDYAVYQPKSDTWAGANYNALFASKSTVGQIFQTRPAEEIRKGFQLKKDDFPKAFVDSVPGGLFVARKSIVFYAFIIKGGNKGGK